MQRRGAANRRRNAPHLMLLALISCFGPVEAVATQSATTLYTALLASLAKHKMICIGLLVLIAIRAVVRLTRLLLHGPPSEANVVPESPPQGHQPADINVAPSAPSSALSSSSFDMISKAEALRLRVSTVFRRHLSDHVGFASAVMAGDANATAIYLWCTALLLLLSVMVPLCAGWATKCCLAFPPAVLAASVLYVRAPATTIPGSASLVLIQTLLVLGRMLGVVRIDVYLLPLPILIVFSAAAYSSARRLPPMGASCRAVAALVLLGLLPSVLPQVTMPVAGVSILPLHRNASVSHRGIVTTDQVTPPGAAVQWAPDDPLLVGALTNNDSFLPPALRACTSLNGACTSWMHDNGAGNHSYTPYFSDFEYFTEFTPTFFGGIAGGASSSPGRGTVTMVALDDEGRPYVYRQHGVSYAPSAMTRLLASEPERLLGHHLRTDAPTSTGLAQLRADGATIPFVVEGGHYWTTAVVLPPSGSPNLPRGSVCPPALRGVDWSEARRVAANGGGYIGISPVKNRGSTAASTSPLRRTQARRRRRRCRRSETLRPQQQPLLRRAAAPWRPQNRGSPQSYRNNALLSPDVVLPVLRSQTTCDAKAPFEPRTAPMPTIDEITDEDLDAFDALTQPSAAPAVAPDPPPAPLPPPPAPGPTETVGTGSAGSLSCAHWFGGIGCAAHQLPSPFAPTCYFDSDGTASDVFAQSFPTVIQAGSFADAMDVDSAFMRAAKCARVGFASPPCTDISVVNSNRDESSACAELTIDCVRALAKVQHEMFCLETVCAIASARGGHLLACLYAECDKAGYIPQLFNLDPLRLGGSQSRCRAYLILTRKDVHAARGPFLPPITYQVKGTPQSIRHLLDPVSLVPPPDATEPKWTAVHMRRDPSHTVAPSSCSSAAPSTAGSDATPSTAPAPASLPTLPGSSTIGLASIAAASALPASCCASKACLPP